MAKHFDFTSGEETWITPMDLQKSLGEFDLDPCAADNMPYRTAKRMVTRQEDGLSFDWGDNRVWLNPPYGKEISKFLEKMHNGIALLPVRTDNRWFHNLVVPRAKAIFFLKGRIKFVNKNMRVADSPAFASMLCAYSQYDICAIKKSHLIGNWFFR